MKKKKQSRIMKALRDSPINFFSDLFIVAMTVLWIVDNLYESIIATVVTMASVALSFQTQTPCFETSMWASIGSNVAIPLGAGGAIWMIKCGVQHAIANRKGKSCRSDFPSVEVEEITSEEELSLDSGSDEGRG